MIIGYLDPLGNYTKTPSPVSKASSSQQDRARCELICLS